ncbi:hypothetical protein AK830_g1760 [Neonectria ditissima]|uniref:Uncharacterized protein n=1 Tax=Neonectria ditissima TaxID=78410 RepID=A0A0P7B5G0_9HYPO|nr:hypothetical protein AK830_g1760 [Neonectria ditissima]
MRSWVPLLLAAWAAWAAASECYYADGSRPTDYDYQPCGDTKTTFSTCCYFGEGDVCLENGLCSQPDKHEYYRAACANKDWSNCPHVCMDEDSNNWLAVEKCGENNTASSDAESSSTAASGGKPAPVGAIAGGVVGGVAVIGFLFVGFCCFKRRGKKKAAATPLDGNGASGQGNGSNGSSQQLNQSSPGEVEGGLGKPGNGGAGFYEKKGYYTQTTPVSGHGVQHSRQQRLMEMEGSAGKVFTEADSKPITSAGAQGSAYSGETMPSPAAQTQQSHNSRKPQHGTAEVEGSSGTVFREADSKPVTSTSAAHGEGDHEQRLPSPVPHHQSQQGVTEVEGSSAKVFTEADSSPIPDAHTQDKSSSGQAVSSLVPQLQQSQQHHLTEVEGSQGKVFAEADSKPVVPASTQEKTSYTQSVSGSSPYHNSQKGATEVEGSSGTVFSEVDSTPINGQSLPSPESRPQQHSMTEMEGSSGKVFTEADSTPVAPTSTQAQQFQQFQQFQAFQQTQQTQGRAVAEVEGSAGKIFTEADSKPISRLVFDEKNAHEMPAAAVAMRQFEQFQKFQQFQQRAAAEVEGSAGKVFSEADSTPINPPGFDEKKAHEMPAAPASMQQFEQFQLFQRFQQAQQHYLAEVEGNLGKVFTEADSRPVVLADPEKNASYVESVSIPEQRKLRSHEMAS